MQHFSYCNITYIDFLFLAKRVSFFWEPLTQYKLRADKKLTLKKYLLFKEINAHKTGC